MHHHVLIIEDEEDVRKAIKLQLAGTSFEILEAENGEQAIEILDANALTVDVIICDLRMPKIAGEEAIAHFRKEYPSTPVIVLTGFPELGRAVDFMKDGVVDYLTKPVEKSKLVSTVEKAAKMRSHF